MPQIRSDFLAENITNCSEIEKEPTMHCKARRMKTSFQVLQTLCNEELGRIENYERNVLARCHHEVRRSMGGAFLPDYWVGKATSDGVLF